MTSYFYSLQMFNVLTQKVGKVISKFHFNGADFKPGNQFAHHQEHFLTCENYYLLFWLKCPVSKVWKKKNLVMSLKSSQRDNSTLPLRWQGGGIQWMKDAIKLHDGKCRIYCFMNLTHATDKRSGCLLLVPYLYVSAILNYWSEYN